MMKCIGLRLLWSAILPCLSLAVLTSGCRDKGTAPSEAKHEEPRVNSGRIAAPAAVRQNLGITFVKVEGRPVQSTLRIPGKFELRPEARREYHVMLAGRIELLVRQYETVEVGQPLFHLDSPEWQKMQSDMVITLNAMSRSHAVLAVAKASETEMKKAVEFVEQRIAALAEASVRQVDLEAELADERNTLPRLKAEVEAAKVEFDSAHAMYDVMLNTAASLTGIAREDLDTIPNRHAHLNGGQPPWRSITRLTIYAKASGVVDRVPVTNAGWVETGDLVLDTADPTALRFHGDAMQSDINLLRNGQRARVVPPQGGSIDLQDTIDGTIKIAFEAHPQVRTIPIYLIPQSLPNWVKSGVTAYMEVYASDDDSPVLAIPETAVIRDGLEVVFFRRDPNDSNTVIRTAADLGVSDGRWIEVKSGVMLGDEIVLSGVYPLMLASSSSGERQEGGHFHSDGTFHAGEDE